jgi:dolichol kinase
VTALTQATLIAGSAALMLVIMGAVKLLGSRYAWSPELQRKCVHVATGLYALTFPFIFSTTLPVLILLALVGAVMLVLRHPYLARTGLGSTLHGVDRKSYGELLLALSVGVIFYFSIGKPVLYVLPIAVLTLSDAAAALIGTRYGRKHFAVEAGIKSLEGVVMFFLVTWIVAMVILLLMTDIGRLNVVLLSVVVAAFGALVEADSWRGFDNLFVPVGIHLLLAQYMDMPVGQLLLLTAMFVVALLAIVTLAPQLGLSNHAARASTVLVFLILAVTAPHNAILPIVAVLAHLAARSARPCKSPYPDLDFLAAVAGVALFWLFLGEYSAQNSLNVYNLTFAGAALVFVALAAGRRILPIMVATALLFASVLLIAHYNGANAQWHGMLWPWVAASFVICLAVPLLRPELLDRYRAPRSLALALPVPLALFATKAFLS